MRRRNDAPGDAFARFRRLDGRHPFKRRVPGGFVDYPARRVRGTEVVHFNFALAREMGLIRADHPERLTAPGARGRSHRGIGLRLGA